MPKQQLAIFVLIDLILIAAVLVAVFQHMKVSYVMLAFILFSMLNSIFLIVTVVKRTGTK